MRFPRKLRTPKNEREEMTNQEKFFYDNAGYSYNAATETAEEGRVRCAKALAAAESEMMYRPWYVEWTDDDQDAQFQDENGEWQEAPAVVAMLMRYFDDPDRQVDCLASLGGITESDNATERANYRRVVEAELALQALEESHLQSSRSK